MNRLTVFFFCILITSNVISSQINEADDKVHQKEQFYIGFSGRKDA